MVRGGFVRELFGRSRLARLDLSDDRNDSDEGDEQIDRRSERRVRFHPRDPRAQAGAQQNQNAGQGAEDLSPPVEQAPNAQAEKQQPCENDQGSGGVHGEASFSRPLDKESIRFARFEDRRSSSEMVMGTFVAGSKAAIFTSASTLGSPGK